MTKERIVHIGYPKTGTTFLQNQVFPRLNGIHYVDYNACRAIFPSIIYRDRIDYQLSEIEELISSFESAEKPNLFSFEALCGQPYGGAKGMNRTVIAQTLKGLGFSKVIITVRNPIKAIDSYYRQYVIHGGTLSFKQFLDLEDKRNWSVKHFNLGYLEYAHLIEVYEDLFGSENVLVLAQEDLLGKFDSAIEKISGFTATIFDDEAYKKRGKSRSHESLTNLSTLLIRYVNFLTYNTIRPTGLITKHFSTRNIWLGFKLILDPFLLRFVSSSSSYVKKYKLADRLTSFYSKANKKLEKYGIHYPS